MDAALEVTTRVSNARQRSNEYQSIAAEQYDVGDATAARQSLALALKAAAQISNAKLKVDAYRYTAVVQAEVGDTDEARQSLLLARQAAAGIEADTPRDFAYGSIASDLLDMGDIDEAKATANLIGDDERNSGINLSIAEAYINEPGSLHLKDALEMADQMAGYPSAQVRVYVHVARMMGPFTSIEGLDRARQTLARAQEVAARMDDDDESKGFAYYDIVKVQYILGDTAGAVRAAERYIKPYSRAEVLIWMAEGEALLDLPEARKLYERAKVAALKIGPPLTEKYHQYSMLQKIAISQARAGEVGAAKETVALIERESEQNGAYRAIALEQAKAGDVAGAKATAALIRDAEVKVWTYKWLAEEQTKAGDVAGARETLEQANAVAAEMETGKRKAEALEHIAEEQTKAGDVAGAKATAAEQARVKARAKLNEEIEAWTGSALYYSDPANIFYGGLQWPELIEKQKREDPDDIPMMHALWAWDIARAFEGLRKEEAKWRDQKAHAAP